MRYWRKLMLFSAPLLLAGTLVGCYSGYGHDRYGRPPYGGGYGYRVDPYRVGYERGFEHGLSDRRNGRDFNFEHDSEFRRGYGDRYTTERFRSGYVRGYEEGYYGRRY